MNINTVYELMKTTHKIHGGDKNKKLSVKLSFSNKVGVAGFEPATSASQTRRDNRATLHPENGYHFRTANIDKT